MLALSIHWNTSTKTTEPRLVPQGLEVGAVVFDTTTFEVVGVFNGKSKIDAFYHFDAEHTNPIEYYEDGLDVNTLAKDFVNFIEFFFKDVGISLVGCDLSQTICVTNRLLINLNLFFSHPRLKVISQIDLSVIHRILAGKQTKDIRDVICADITSVTAPLEVAHLYIAAYQKLVTPYRKQFS